MQWIVWIAGILFGIAGTPSQATISIEFIDMGVPADGLQTMHGWRGVVVRASSDEFAIARFEGEIFGSIAQRWLDPTESGQDAWYGLNEVDRSPGPYTANNTTLSDFNFDSHLLGEPSDFTSTVVSGEERRPFYLYRTGLVSTPLTGYGGYFVQAPPFDITDFALDGGGGRLVFDAPLVPQLHANTVDVAYIVTDSVFSAYVIMRDETGSGAAAYRRYNIPEPAALLTLGLPILLITRRIRRFPQRD